MAAVIFMLIWSILIIVIAVAITRRVLRINEIVDELNITNVYLKKMSEVATRQEEKVEEMRKEREERLKNLNGID